MPPRIISEVFNLGSDDSVEIMDIAKIVCKNATLENIKINLTGGVDDGRGWKGDIKIAHLDISKLKKLVSEQIDSTSNLASARVMLDKQSPYLNSFIINFSTSPFESIATR